MVQCSDLLGDQKLLHGDECVSRWIVMMQNLGFFLHTRPFTCDKFYSQAESGLPCIITD